MYMMESLSNGEINNIESINTKNEQADARSIPFIDCAVSSDRIFPYDDSEPEREEYLANSTRIQRSKAQETVSDSVVILPGRENCTVHSDHALCDHEVSDAIIRQKSKILRDHGMEREHHKHLSNAISMQKNRNMQIQTVKDPIIRIPEKMKSTRGLCSDSTKPFDQKHKERYMDVIPIKYSDKKTKLGIGNAGSLRGFQVAEGMTRHQMDNRLAGSHVRQNAEATKSSEQEWLKEICHFRSTEMMKDHGCLRDDTDLVKKGKVSCDTEQLKKRHTNDNDTLACHLLTDRNMTKKSRFSHSLDMLKEGYSCNYIVPKNDGRSGNKECSLSHNNTSKSLNMSEKHFSKNLNLSEKYLSSNSIKENCSSRENSIQVSKLQERCINVKRIKRFVKPKHTSEKEQSKQDQGAKKQAAQGLNETRFIGKETVASELTSAKSSLQRKVQVFRKQKGTENEQLDKHSLQNVDQIRHNKMKTGKLVSLDPDINPRQSLLLKAALKERIESIGKEALSEPGLREKVRNIAKLALCEAGFKIELRCRRSRDYQDSVYISPKGYAYWSLPRAWRALKEMQAESSGMMDDNSSIKCGQNADHKSDIKVADFSLNGTVSGKRRQDLALKDKKLTLSVSDQMNLVRKDSNSKVLSALKLPADGSSYQEVTNAELSDLFIEDLKLFKRIKSRVQVSGVNRVKVSDKPIKEIKVRSSPFLHSAKLNCDKTNRHEGTSKKPFLVPTKADTNDGRKRKRTDDLKVNGLREPCLNPVLSSKKKTFKAHDSDMATVYGVKNFQHKQEKNNDVNFLKHRKETDKSVVLKKLPSEAATKEVRSSCDSWMNAPIRDLIKKVNRKEVSPLKALASKKSDMSHKKIHNGLQRTQENKASYRGLKYCVSSTELTLRKNGSDKEKSVDSESIIRKSKSAYSDFLPHKTKKNRILPGKEAASHVKPAENRGIHSACRLEVRESSSRKDEGSDIDLLKRKQTVLSWLIERGVLSEREKLHCLVGKKNQIVKQGLATSDGILCKCCKRTFTISDFKAHAVSQYQNIQNTFTIIMLKGGRSLLDCQIQAWGIETELRKVKNYVGVTDDDTNDDTCMLCGDGGELICCDHCPSTFHISCLQIEDVPEGNWYCPKCCCHICGGSQYDDKGESKLLVDFCKQCEHEYHVSCIHGGVVSEDNWFCGVSCEKIYTGLRSLIGTSHALDNGLSWTLLRCTDKDKGVKLSKGLETIVMQHSKLAVALNVMQECFVPMVDPRTNIDMIPHVVFNCWSEFYRLDYRGFYTVLLEKADEIISVASIRVHGSKVAEMPLIGTRQQYRRQGMCRRLVTVIEKMLSSLSIEIFALPAIPELLETWTCAFGFDRIDTAQNSNFKKLSMMVFPGTQLLQKSLIKADQIKANMNAGLGYDLQMVEPVLSESKQETCEAYENAAALLKEKEGNIECSIPLLKQVSEVESVLSDYKQETCEAYEHTADLLKEKQGSVECSLSLLNQEVSEVAAALQMAEQGNANFSANQEANEALDIAKAVPIHAEDSTDHCVSLSSWGAKKPLDMENRECVLYSRAGDASYDHSSLDVKCPVNACDNVENALQLVQRDEQSVDMDRLRRLNKDGIVLTDGLIQDTMAILHYNN